jgi:hypothetical protein
MVAAGQKKILDVDQLKSIERKVDLLTFVAEFIAQHGRAPNIAMDKGRSRKKEEKNGGTYLPTFF